MYAFIILICGLILHSIQNNEDEVDFDQVKHFSKRQ